MPNVVFLRRVIELSACNSVDTLLDAAAALLPEELGVNGFIEVWTCDGTRRRRGLSIDELSAHRIWSLLFANDP